MNRLTPIASSPGTTLAVSRATSREDTDARVGAAVFLGTMGFFGSDPGWRFSTVQLRFLRDHLAGCDGELPASRPRSLRV